MDTNHLIACPVCDALYAATDPAAGHAKRCGQCGYRLMVGRSDAIARVVGLSLTSVILMGLVVFSPFLELKAGAFGNSASVLDIVLSFSSGVMVPLSFAVLAFIIILPLARFILLSYALLPILFKWPAWPGAKEALRLGFALKPWAMAEIFMIGVAVALIKLAGMASLSLGPAFWAFVAIVLLTAYSDTFMCRNTLWSALNTARK